MLFSISLVVVADLAVAKNQQILGDADANARDTVFRKFSCNSRQASNLGGEP